jgi:hypothetical protein
MFPYLDNALDVWSGFYTTRPNLKKEIKDMLSLFTAMSRAFSESMISVRNVVSRENMKNAYESLQETVAVLSHHDTITGTSTHFTMSDAWNNIAKAQNDSLPIFVKVLNDKLVASPLEINPDQWELTDQDLNRNLTSSDGTLNDFLLLVNNPSLSQVE